MDQENTSSAEPVVIPSKCYSFNEKERKIRKHWLVAAICLYVIMPISIGAYILFLSKDTILFSLIALSSFAFTNLIALFIMWHCAYKKYGTTLLTFSLILAPIELLSTTKEAIAGHNLLEMLSIIPIIPVFIWFYVLSLKLRKINKKIKAHKITADCI